MIAGISSRIDCEAALESAGCRRPGPVANAERIASPRHRQSAGERRRQRRCSLWRRLVIPVFAVLVAFGFIVLATVRWDAWVGSAAVQTTNDAYIKRGPDAAEQPGRRRGAQRSPSTISSASRPAICWSQIDPADYEAQVAAGRGQRRGRAGRARQSRQPGRAAICDHRAGRSAAGVRGGAGGRGPSGAGAATIADADRSRHTAEARTGDRGLRQARRPTCGPAGPSSPRSATSWKYCPGPRSSARRTCWAPRLPWPRPGSSSATPGSSRRSTASSAQRQVQAGDYVNIGSNLINVVPLPNVYVIANYKETQLTRVKPGQPVDITVDTLLRRNAARPRRADRAGQRIAIRAAAARQCDRQFHQGGAAHAGADRVRQGPAAAGAAAAGHVGRHAHSRRPTRRPPDGGK